MNFKRQTAVLMVVLAVSTAWGIDGRVEVLSDRVNLRARAKADAEVAGQVNRGAILDVRGVDGDWVGVAAPTNIGLWVNTGFIQNDKVATEKLNVRSGAGINYPSVALLLKDAPVRIRSQMGQWTEIDPPAGAVLWVHHDFVREVATPGGGLTGLTSPATNAVVSATNQAVTVVVAPPKADVPALESPVPPAGAGIPVVEVKEVADGKAEAGAVPPPDLAERGLVPLAGQGEVMEREGSLHKTSLLDFGRVSNYCLVDWERGRPVTICYIRGNNAQLKTFEGRRLRIKGDGYWIKGGAKPVIVPRQITPLASPAN